ncbi:CBS domain-containing protein [candidate division KSB1 bacterium]|nr:CBS domain-containing protein [candidate division KSB1 bacterium]
MDSSTLRFPIETLHPSKPICVRIGTNVNDAIKTMQDNRIGCVCVVEDQELKGIITERDILTRVIGGDLDANKVKVEEVMTPNPEYLFMEDELAFALNRMQVGGFRHIPLTDLNGHPTGVISVKDIVAHLIKNLDD